MPRRRQYSLANKHPELIRTLGVALVFAAVYLVSWPYWFIFNKEQFYLQQQLSAEQLAAGQPAAGTAPRPLPAALEELPASETKVSRLKKVSAYQIVRRFSRGDKLFIPKIGVDAYILENDNAYILNYGPWRMPLGSTPDQGGNTIITSHRWQWPAEDPRSFIDIDRLQVGDEVQLLWQGKLYYYRISQIKQVKPQQTEILYPTKQPRLTIFTCTPLYSTDYRLVLIADLTKVEQLAD